MPRFSWLVWLITFLALTIVGVAVTALLSIAKYPATASWVGTIAGGLVGLWVLAGIIRWRHLPWVKWGGVLYLGSIFVVIVCGVRINPSYFWSGGEQALRAPAWWSFSGKFGLFAIGWKTQALCITGFWFMTVGFIIGIWLLRLVLAPGYGLLGVARTVVDQAMRMKIALIFILMLLLLVPTLAITGDQSERLSYRIQAFLSFSMLFALTLPLALMTIFLACSTICGDISNRYIFMTMTKPLSRLGYLLGKWLGIVLLNAVLLAVGGAGIYVLTHVLRMQGTMNEADRIAVDNQVLVAREVVTAIAPPGLDLPGLVEERLARVKSQDKDAFVEGMSNAKRTETINSIRTQIIAEWYTIPPTGSKTYRFTGLNRAKRFGDFVQLRFNKVKTSIQSPDEMIHMALKVNNYYWPQDPNTGLPRQVSIKWNQPYLIDVPLEFIKDDGVLDLTITHIYLPNPQFTLNSAISIPPNEGMEMRYQVDTFEMNFTRALLILWVFLSFLAMLGLTAGTNLSFPVASFFTIMIMLVALVSGFLADSLNSWGAVIPTDAQAATGTWTWWTAFKDRLSKWEFYEAFKMVFRYFGILVIWIAPAFSEYNPISLVVDGKLVSNEMLGNAFLKIGGIWTGSCALLGWLIFRRRELARVTV